MIGVNIDLHRMLLYLSCCNGEACFDHSKMGLLPSRNEHRAIRIAYPKAFAAPNARQTFSYFSRFAVMGVNELINFYGRHFAIGPLPLSHLPSSHFSNWLLRSLAGLIIARKYCDTSPSLLHSP